MHFYNIGQPILRYTIFDSQHADTENACKHPVAKHILKSQVQRREKEITPEWLSIE